METARLPPDKSTANIRHLPPALTPSALGYSTGRKFVRKLSVIVNAYQQRTDEKLLTHAKLVRASSSMTLIQNQILIHVGGINVRRLFGNLEHILFRTGVYSLSGTSICIYRGHDHKLASLQQRLRAIRAWQSIRTTQSNLW